MNNLKNEYQDRYALLHEFCMKNKLVAEGIVIFRTVVSGTI